MAINAPVSLFDSRQVWRGRAAPVAAPAQPTGWPELDAVLPAGGWPEAALTEILLPADGVGELRLLMPTLARLSRTERSVLLIAPPYAPCVAGWRAHGVDMRKVEIVNVEHERQVSWAAEQSLRAGCCAAVLAWPRQIDERQLRRLQVAADSGRALAFVFRDRKHAEQASPAALRIEIETNPAQLRVRKCRGGAAPATPIAFELFSSPFKGEAGRGMVDVQRRASSSTPSPPTLHGSDVLSSPATPPSAPASGAHRRADLRSASAAIRPLEGEDLPLEGKGV